MERNAQSIVDADGNINSSILSKELKDALDFDIKYKQTDNMKKRAVKVAHDYDQFKAMVACAHLKKLSSKEVESLSHAKKGWVKSVVKDNSSSAHILCRELEDDQLRSSSQTLSAATVSDFVDGGVKKKPKTPMEMERDLRRFPTAEDQIRYLGFVGLKRAKAIFAAGADTDLLEQILSTLLACKDNLPVPLLITEAAVSSLQPSTPSSSDQPQHGEGEQGLQEPVSCDNPHGEKAPAQRNENGEGTSTTAVTSKSFDNALLLKWLKALSECDKFPLMVQFASNHLVAAAVDCIGHLATDLGVKSDKAIAKYQAGL